MKAGIVSLSTIAKHGGRLDARFYLGAYDKDVANAEARVERDEKRLTASKRNLEKTRASRDNGAVPGVKVIK